MVDTMTRERRQDARVNWQAPASFRPQDDSRSHQGTTMDLSRGGSLIRSPIPLEEGSGLELRIDLGEFSLGPVAGRVKRSNPVFYGPGHLVAVEFSERNDALMNALQGLSEG